MVGGERTVLWEAKRISSSRRKSNKVLVDIAVLEIFDSWPRCWLSGVVASRSQR